MLGLLRRICSLLAQILSRVVRPFSSTAVDNSPHSEDLPQEKPQDDWETNEWDKGTDDWEPFTVKVVPSQEEQNTEQPPEPDLFSDMQPVFKKPTMIRVARKEDSRLTNVDAHKFTVEDNPLSEEASGGLGVWTDEGDQGWDHQDVTDLVQNSKEALRSKRVQDREQRKLQQERMRAQLKTGTHGLGVRVS